MRHDRRFFDELRPAQEEAPDAPDDDAVAALLTTVAQNGRVILLFTDHASFKAWQRKLSQVLA